MGIHDLTLIDWLNLGINGVAALGGLLGLFLAIRAYKIAKAAGRVTFELEALRELGRFVNENIMRRDQNMAQDPFTAIQLLIYGNVRYLVALFPPGELPVWQHLCDGDSTFESAQELLDRKQPNLADLPKANDAAFWGRANVELHDEIIEAIKRRMI